MRDFNGLDLQSLSCLATLVSERSVSLAAQRLGMRQSAMSKVLAKLREALDDPLLVRTRHGMVPTERGLQVSEGARRCLEDLESVLDPVKFDADVATGHVTLTMADNWLMLLFPDILQAVRQQAPNVTVTTRPGDKARVSEWLDDGFSDIAIGTFENVGPAVHRTQLYADELVCMVSKSHPQIRRGLSLEQYLDANHVVIRSDSSMNAVLARRGLRRKVVTQIHSALAWGYSVAQTDLVATLSSRLANHFATFLPVRVMPLPLPVPQLKVCMFWHERSHKLALQRWLRETVKDVIKTK